MTDCPTPLLIRLATHTFLLLLGVMLAGISLVPAKSADENTNDAKIARIEKKLSQIKIPSVAFRDTTLKEALKFLQEQSVEHDSQETDPQNKGVRFIPQSADTSLGLGDTKITLKLTDVPLAEALRYTTSLAQLRFQVSARGVIITPISSAAPANAKDGASPANKEMKKADPAAEGVFDKAGNKVPGLEFVARRQQSYILEFAGRPDEKTLQVTRHASSNYPRNTFLLEKGDESGDKMFRIDDYKESSALNEQGIQVDTSTLEITYLRDGSTHQLPRRTKLTIPTYFAEFKLEGGGKTYVKKGDTFSLPGAPQTEYKLTEVTEKKAVVELATE